MDMNPHAVTLFRWKTCDLDIEQNRCLPGEVVDMTAFIAKAHPEACEREYKLHVILALLPSDSQLNLFQYLSLTITERNRCLRRHDSGEEKLLRTFCNPCPELYYKIHNNTPRRPPMRRNVLTVVPGSGSSEQSLPTCLSRCPWTLQRTISEVHDCFAVSFTINNVCSPTGNYGILSVASNGPHTFDTENIPEQYSRSH